MIAWQRDNAGWRASGPGSNGAGRQGWVGTVAMLAGTLAVALVSYSISMSVSAERSAAERLARENAALSRELRALDAEFRVRMRLPQLERWNREVLGLRPIEASQFLDSPLLLASYGTPPMGAPAPQPALARDMPAPVADERPLVRTAVVEERSPVRTAAADKGKPAAAGLDPELLAAVAALADAPAAPRQPQLTAVVMNDDVAAPADPPGRQ